MAKSFREKLDVSKKHGVFGMLQYCTLTTGLVLVLLMSKYISSYYGGGNRCLGI